MRNDTLLIIFILCFLVSCGKEDDGPKEKRFLEKVVIEKANLDAWDLLNGPDMKLTYRDGLVDSLSLSGESEVFMDVAQVTLPITFEDIPFELTSFMEFKVIDVDDFAPDQTMFEEQFNPYDKSENGNPFVLSSTEWRIVFHWKVN